MGDGEKFQVERVCFYEHSRKSLAEHLALKKLHSRLRIGDGKTDENLNECKITP